MPMIDVFAAAGTFPDPHRLAVDLAATLMAIERVPDIPMFRNNTAAFVHEMGEGRVANVNGDASYVRVQVLTNAGALSRDQQIAVVSQFTHLVSDAAPPRPCRPHLGAAHRSRRRWLGTARKSSPNEDLVAAARARSPHCSPTRPRRHDAKLAPRVRLIDQCDRSEPLMATNDRRRMLSAAVICSAQIARLRFSAAVRRRCPTAS